MRNFLAVLLGLIAAVLILRAAQYLDVTPRFHPDPAPTATAEALPETQPVTQPAPPTEAPAETQAPAEDQRLVFTFAGDCTLGGHTAHTHAGYGFLKTVEHNYDHPFQNIITWFEEDDFTMVNLEGALTDQGKPSGSLYSFRGYPEYAAILTRGSVDMVTIANNHSLDYGQAGYDQTRSTLEEYGVAYVESNGSAVYTLDSGLTVGVYATCYNSIHQEDVLEGISALKEQGVDLLIYAPHWGVENAFRPTEQQTTLGRQAIDAGADIVYGCHPHVLQPIEEYGDGVIFYSLGNFSFGGNLYPADYDTAIIQQEILVSAEGDVSLGERTIIPCSISSIERRNNFQPTPYPEGSDEYHRVLSKLDGTYAGPNLPVG